MSRPRGRSTGLLVLFWALGSSVAGAAIGLTLGLFRGGAIEMPTLAISILFGVVVGFTAMLGALLFPRLAGLAPPLRILLLLLMLIGGSVAGSIAVLNLYPLFIFSDPRQAVAIVAINALLALIVGCVAFAYEGMRARLQASLREIEQVRLAESRSREEAARAELAALQARINPHFFFNTLNTIASLIEDDPGEAGEVVQTLADLFRYTFEVASRGPVRLQEEVAFTRDYLAVEQARFGPRLRVEWELAPQALAVRLPGLLVQPLVENAIGHGIAPLPEGGTLRISARVEGGELCVDVCDDGAGLGLPRADLIRDGHGLGNVRQRLAAFYDGNASLTLESNPAGRGTRARLRLPASTPVPGLGARSSVADVPEEVRR